MDSSIDLSSGKISKQKENNKEVNHLLMLKNINQLNTRVNIAESQENQEEEIEEFHRLNWCIKLMH